MLEGGQGDWSPEGEGKNGLRKGWKGILGLNQRFSFFKKSQDPFTLIRIIENPNEHLFIEVITIDIYHIRN